MFLHISKQTAHQIDLKLGGWFIKGKINFDHAHPVHTVFWPLIRLITSHIFPDKPLMGLTSNLGSGGCIFLNPHWPLVGWAFSVYFQNNCCDLYLVGAFIMSLPRHVWLIGCDPLNIIPTIPDLWLINWFINWSIDQFLQISTNLPIRLTSSLIPQIMQVDSFIMFILPEASFGLRVLSLPASVCVCLSVCLSVCVSITCLSAQ